MRKIATEKEAYDIGKHGTPEENKCCTMSKAKEFGYKVIDEYESNQLVCKDSLIGYLYLEIDIFLNDGSYHSFKNLLLSEVASPCLGLAIEERAGDWVKISLYISLTQ